MSSHKLWGLLFALFLLSFLVMNVRADRDDYAELDDDYYDDEEMPE